MSRIKTILVVILVTGLSMPLFSQSSSTQGKEFWLSFMHNGYREHTSGGWITNQVLISAKRGCSGTITNPLTGWEEPFTVRANSITTVEIPEAQGYHDGSNYENASNKAIKISANDTISVYCTNIAHLSFDASFVLPTESLGDEYIIQCFDQSQTGENGYVINNETTAFLIIATEDNTEIDITPTVNTLGGHTAETTFTITLNAGQTYQVRSVRYGDQRDLSGTHVIASDCKKIAVFNGNTLTCIPTTLDNGYDHVFEQAMPLRSWGRNFVVTGSLNRNRDFVKITSSADNNVIKKNGERLITLQTGRSYVFPIDENEVSCFLQADYPTAVYLFNNSSHDRALGDPSMVWISPVEQRIDEVTFATFDHSNINITNHSVNIIVNTSDIGQVYFDNQLLSPLEFRRVNGNNDYSYTRLNISHNVHHISCANGFNAHVYGFGNAKGYAYLVGSNAIDLTTSITINDVQVQTDEIYPYCIDQPVTFSAEVNYQEYNLLWNFGDGTTSTQNPTTHVYHDSQVYTAYLYIDADASGCISANSDTLTFYIDATQQYITESDEICAGELYSGFGFNNVIINNDTILARLQDNPNFPECQDSLLVYITAKPQYHIPIFDTRCWQGEPSVYDGNGFSFEYDNPGTYERTIELQSMSGCDSIVTLTLTVSDRVTYDFEHHECSGSYIWDGRTYDQAGTYSWNYVSSGGCDSIATLHLTMGLSQYYEFDTIVCGSFIWDGIEYDSDGDYTRQYTTLNNCDSTIVCHLSVSGTIQGETEYQTLCDSCVWHDSTYFMPGTYAYVFKSATAAGCDSIVYLDLTISHSPVPSEIYPIDTSNHTPHWVITATEFQVTSYAFSLHDLNRQEWDSVRWEFESPEVEWFLDRSTTPFLGKSCNMYVLNYVEDTVWLRATAFNSCDTIGKSQRYWFLCSFYGIDEQLDNRYDFNVVPNPNNGQMVLNFTNLTGKIDIKIYDMRGVLIDKIQTYNTIENSSYNYDLNLKAQGLYLFVVTAKEGILTKKVIVAP